MTDLEPSAQELVELAVIKLMTEEEWAEFDEQVNQEVARVSADESLGREERSAAVQHLRGAQVLGCFARKPDAPLRMHIHPREEFDYEE
ncbi:hypothetical protein OWM54_43100 [Myxococcus sp. MISCRS1]|uniref:hypothetical protein n=1 Tax=Myxococcus sp. MISCRS1 TaxID=2996786 RepID=UPI00226D90C1|nr:hypothetical protein [Myxococcus sp. MISCRS1]MCY1003948.1 hypothetical protein [Myxococcus sp. MISCRS1]MCY1003954.1 hypothetical protein [Myxococcus sp. MISCRS1]